MPLLVLEDGEEVPPPCCLQTCRVLPYTLSVIAFLTAESLPLSLFLISKLYCAFCNSYPSYQCLPEALWVCWCAHYLCSLEQLLIAPCNCQIQCSEITWISFETLLENHSICCLLFLCCWQRFMPEIAHLSGTVFSEEPPSEYCQDELYLHMCEHSSVCSLCQHCCLTWLLLCPLAAQAQHGNSSETFHRRCSREAQLYLWICGFISRLLLFDFDLL